MVETEKLHRVQRDQFSSLVFRHSGKRPGAGRKSKQDNAVEARAEALVVAYLKKHVHKVLDAYLKARLGIKKRRESKSGVVYYEIEMDTSNQRHWLDKYKADAARTVNLASKNLEDYLDDIAQAGKEEKAE